MINIKPIRTKEDYREALGFLDALLATNPAEGSEEEDQMMVIAALIEDYEKSSFPECQVEPVEAIRFRMEQLGLKNSDLIQYLGSKSRVSEILSGKRSLTVRMIKNLEEGLGIPASSLVGSAGVNTSKRWTPKIIALMADRGYFGENYNSKNCSDILSKGVLKDFLNSSPALQPALLRQTNYRDSANIDKQLLNSWLIKVTQDAKKIIESESVPICQFDDIEENWTKKLISFSLEDDGPLKVIDFLKQKGIVLIVEPSLPNTRLDGAVVFMDGRAIIGLTLRHNRVDNFWFTLMHEIAHVVLHANTDDIFFDNLDFNPDLVNDIEKEADRFARDSMISPEIWNKSPLRYHANPTIIKTFANKNGISPAIVAGRLRYESGQWHKYSSMVTESPVRQLFGEKYGRD